MIPCLIQWLREYDSVYLRGIEADQQPNKQEESKVSDDHQFAERMGELAKGIVTERLRVLGKLDDE